MSDSAFRVSSAGPGGFTLDELRAFIAQCEDLGVHGDARFRCRQTNAWHPDGGHVTRITIETPRYVSPPRRNGFGVRPSA
jgi:hypothetical protein